MFKTVLDLKINKFIKKNPDRLLSQFNFGHEQVNPVQSSQRMRLPLIHRHPMIGSRPQLMHERDRSVVRMRRLKCLLTRSNHVQIVMFVTESKLRQ